MGVINDKIRPNYKLVKALVKKGYKDFELTYQTNQGWQLDGYGLPSYLGYTIKSALKEIENIKGKSA